MKVSREVKSEINRRAYFIAQAAMRRWAAQMQAAIEADILAPADIGIWWPAEIPPGTHRGEGFGSRRLVFVAPADVCASCGRELPDMNTWQHNAGGAPVKCPHCGMVVLAVLPGARPGAPDPGLDATDHLAGF